MLQTVNNEKISNMEEKIKQASLNRNHPVSQLAAKFGKCRKKFLRKMYNDSLEMFDNQHKS